MSGLARALGCPPLVSLAVEAAFKGVVRRREEALGAGEVVRAPADVADDVDGVLDYNWVAGLGERHRGGRHEQRAPKRRVSMR